MDPEAELRARLLLYRAYRDAGVRLAEDAIERIGLFRREPSVAHAAGMAGSRPAEIVALDPSALVRALARLAAIAPPPELPPEAMARTISITERADIIRMALRDAPRVVLQDLLTGVRDRVVIAITFLAMLELMKRREIVVEQASPWGPIVARETTAAEKAAAGVDGTSTRTFRSTNRSSRSRERRSSIRPTLTEADGWSCRPRRRKPPRQPRRRRRSS